MVQPHRPSFANPHFSALLSTSVAPGCRSLLLTVYPYLIAMRWARGAWRGSSLASLTQLTSDAAAWTVWPWFAEVDSEAIELLNWLSGGQPPARWAPTARSHRILAAEASKSSIRSRQLACASTNRFQRVQCRSVRANVAPVCGVIPNLVKPTRFSMVPNGSESRAAVLQSVTSRNDPEIKPLFQRESMVFSGSRTRCTTTRKDTAADGQAQ
mmetsp:Transcript_48855/g.110877  ORF Transcript_48855/g.110877 Transcript_48855/m.110877 type:complete len:212 (+) Transcript_48855:317-952(+)